jgi:hypothetical protein
MEDYYGTKSRRAREYIRSLLFKKRFPFKGMFPKTTDLALDLLEKLLHSTLSSASLSTRLYSTVTLRLP